MRIIKSHKGFTLIELIVVIALLAVLASIAIPRLSGYIESARQANDQQNAAIVCNAAALYYSINSNMTMPQNSNDWITTLLNAQLIYNNNLILKSKGYSLLTVSGPDNGIIKVELTGNSIANYIYTIEK